MTLDEAIKHCEEKANELRKDSDIYKNFWNSQKAQEDCLECAKEHEQLAEWLKELKKLRKCRQCPLIKEECKLCGFTQEADNDK